MRMKQHSVSPSPPPSVLNPPVGTTIPPLYHRDKKKLSSHSMHSPSRSANYMYDKQPYPLPVEAIGAVPTATTTPIHITTKQTVQPPPPQHYPSEFYLNNGNYPDYQHHHGHMSPQLSPFVHGSPPPPLPPPSSKQLQHRPQSPNRQHQMLRRTASSVSAITTNPTVVHNPALSPSSGSAAMSPTTGSGDIRIESPKNMTVIQQAKFQPYKEVSKPFEMSDFYKYSTKFRQKPDAATMATSTQTQQPKVYQTASGGQPIQQ